MTTKKTIWQTVHKYNMFTYFINNSVSGGNKFKQKKLKFRTSIETLFFHRIKKIYLSEYRTCFWWGSRTAVDMIIRQKLRSLSYGMAICGAGGGGFMTLGTVQNNSNVIFPFCCQLFSMPRHCFFINKNQKPFLRKTHLNKKKNRP